MNVESMLKEFGLTEYEIKAYTNLLKMDIATAEQISNMGNIPLPRVYDTLSELQKKGFVLISKGRPKKFKPIQPKKALSNLIEIKKKDFESGMKILKSNVIKLDNELSKLEKNNSGKEKKYEIWSIEKKKNMSNILDEQKKLAKNELLIFSGDMSWIKDISSILKQNIKKGVDVKVIVHEPKNKEWRENIKLAKKIGVKVKTGYSGLMRGHIIDNNLVSIALKQSGNELNVPGPAKTDPRFWRYELVTSDNPILVESMKENFNFWWEKL